MTATLQDSVWPVLRHPKSIDVRRQKTRADAGYAMRQRSAQRIHQHVEIEHGVGRAVAQASAVEQHRRRRRSKMSPRNGPAGRDQPQRVTGSRRQFVRASNLRAPLDS